MLGKASDPATLESSRSNGVKVRRGGKGLRDGIERRGRPLAEDVRRSWPYRQLNEARKSFAPSDGMVEGDLESSHCEGRTESVDYRRVRPARKFTCRSQSAWSGLILGAGQAVDAANLSRTEQPNPSDSARGFNAVPGDQPLKLGDRLADGPWRIPGSSRVDSRRTNCSQLEPPNQFRVDKVVEDFGMYLVLPLSELIKVDRFITNEHIMVIS